MLSRFFGGRRTFDSLSEQEILALAISSEEEDGRIYRAYADGLREEFPQSAKVFDAMADEEDGHRAALIELHQARFGERIPLIRRDHVRGYYDRRPDWLVRPLGIDHVRTQAETMERQAQRFYERRRQAHRRRLDPQAARRSRRLPNRAMNRWRSGWSANTCRNRCGRTRTRPNGGNSS